MVVLHLHVSLSSSLKGGDVERAHALYDMSVTAAVSHAPMSWLNDEAPENTTTWECRPTPIKPCAQSQAHAPYTTQDVKPTHAPWSLLPSSPYDARVV